MEQELCPSSDLEIERGTERKRESGGRSPPGFPLFSVSLSLSTTPLFPGKNLLSGPKEGALLIIYPSPGGGGGRGRRNKKKASFVFFVRGGISER